MKNKRLNFFQRRTAPIGFKDHAVLDNFIQESLDKFTFSDPSQEMYASAGVYSRLIISDKSTIPDLIIYNKTFNKNDCFENCNSRIFNSFPRVRFILNTQQKEKYPKRSNKNKKQFEFKEVKDDKEEKVNPNDDEDKAECGNDEVNNNKIVIEAIQDDNTGEIKQDSIIKTNEGNIIQQEPLPQRQVESEREKEDSNVIASSNEELKKLVSQTEESNTTNEPINTIDNNENDNSKEPCIKEIIKEDKIKEETFLTNPNNFLAQIQENQKKMKEKELNKDKIIEEINKCEDIFIDTSNKDNEISNEKDTIKDQENITKAESSNQIENNQTNSANNANKTKDKSQIQHQTQTPPIPSMIPPQGGDFTKMPFIPGIPPYMCYPFLQPFPMPTPLNYPMNTMNPMPQMGMNMNINPNIMPPYLFEDEDDEEEDPMMNNFNDNFQRYNPTLFLENPALIVKKNLIDSNWFVMKGNKILGNYNSEQLLFFLGEQIRQQNKFDGISITDYHTDVFFKPNNLFDILRKNVPKLKKKYIQNKMQTMMMNMPTMNNNMMPNPNIINSNSNREGNALPNTIAMQQNRGMNLNQNKNKK